MFVQPEEAVVEMCKSRGNCTFHGALNTLIQVAVQM